MKSSIKVKLSPKLLAEINAMTPSHSPPKWTAEMDAILTIAWPSKSKASIHNLLRRYHPSLGYERMLAHARELGL